VKKNLNQVIDENTMVVGQENELFTIKKDSIVQIKEQGDWYNVIGFVAYIVNGVAYVMSPQKQTCGLYNIGFWNCKNVKACS